MTYHNSQPKNPPHRNADYLAYIRLLPCIGAFCGGKAQAHHVRRSYWQAGTGIKPHDYCSLPACDGCHDPEIEKTIDVQRAIIHRLQGYIKFKKYDERDYIEALMEFIESKRKKRAGVQ